MVPEKLAIFAIRDSTMPLLCGKETLTFADRANANCMTIALRLVVDLHRLANGVMTVYRKILGYSISHDEGTVCIYGHYPEINGNIARYFRAAIREYTYIGEGRGEVGVPIIAH